MKYTIKAFKKKSMPSKFGGTWDIISVKFNEAGEDVFELAGFSKVIKENLESGKVLVGRITSRNWNAKDGTLHSTKVFQAITTEYLYDLILKINPEIENIKTSLNPAAAAKIVPTSDEWTTAPADDTDLSEVDPF